MTVQPSKADHLIAFGGPKLVQPERPGILGAWMLTPLISPVIDSPSLAAMGTSNAAGPDE